MTETDRHRRVRQLKQLIRGAIYELRENNPEKWRPPMEQRLWLERKIGDWDTELADLGYVHTENCPCARCRPERNLTVALDGVEYEVLMDFMGPA